MAKISITLPNITEISLEAADASEMRQIVGLFKSDLLNELVRLPSAGNHTKEVPGEPDNDINVPPKASSQTPDVPATSNGNDHASSTSARDIPEAVPPPLEPRVNPPVEPRAAEPQKGQPAGRQVPATNRSNRVTSANSSIPAAPRNPSIPPELSDPRLGHDFTVFCRTVNPMGDMRMVVAAAEGAARMCSMDNVDAWELGHLFDMTGWPQPHSFTQALRNAARSKFRWLERVPGRSGRYSVTDAGRAVVLKGTNLL